MKIRILGLGFVCAVSLCGQQSKMNWQDYCFNHPTAPFCTGHEDAIKHTPQNTNPGYQSTPQNTPQNGVTRSPFTATPRTASPSRVGAASVQVIGGIDWRFVDPSADALVGFNFSGLMDSPLAHGMIAQLGAAHGLTDKDLQKIFDGLSGVDQLALSVRDNRVVVMVTGRVTESNFPAPEAGMKFVPVSGNAMLMGHAEAVDQAVQRINMKGFPSELAKLAEQQQAVSEFWTIGSPRLAGPEAMSAGVKRFSLTVSLRSRLTSDVAFEFYGTPNPKTLQALQTSLGATTLEGNVLHARTSMEAVEVQQKFGEFAAGPLGQRLAPLMEAARYLPVRDTTVPKQTRPVIYGLDDVPRVVGQGTNQ